MSRSFFAVQEIVEAIPTDGVVDDLAGWLRTQAISLGPSTLLAHADDGVIWGIVTPRGCATGHEAARAFPEAAGVSPPLRGATLQSARLFNPRGEVLLWRTNDTWRARRIRPVEADERPDLLEAFEESQLLWGTRGIRLGDSGLTLVREGSQGLCQVLPLPEVPSAPRRACLRVRNYVAADESGLARVTLSRLMSLSMEDSRA